MFPKLLLPLLAVASIASAHFKLDFPISRGFDEDTEVNFCNGFPTNATGRHTFPLNGSAPVTITSTHDQWQFAIFASADADPTSFAAFNTSGTTNYLVNFGSGSGQGGFCFRVDFSTLATKLNLQNGSLVTLQAEFNGGDGALFQCSDLVLVEGATIPSNISCTNATGSSTTATSTSAAPSASSSNSGAADLVASVGGVVLAAVAGLAVLL